MVFLKFILYAIVLYYCFIFLSRFLLRIFLKRWTSKLKKKFKTKQHVNPYKEQKKGETVVQYKKDDNVDPGGEYVDFEDIDNE